MSQLFFVSDMHFGHTKIIDYCKRPFSSVTEMNETLITNWNAKVRPEDKVYHLGDWAFHNYECIGQLNGIIYSVPGNHDHERRKKIEPFLTHGFLDEVHYLKISKSERFVLCHYPFASWRREYQYHLHGHMHGMHGMGGVHSNRLDVGIDTTPDYAPLHLDEVMQRMATNNAWAQEMQQ